MARQSLSPMKHVDFSDVSAQENYLEKVGRKRKDAPMTHLKYLRKRCGYTLETLSEITSISISYLSRLESGSRRLNTDLIKRLSHAFNCDPSELLQEVSHDNRIIAPIEFSKKRSATSKDVTLPVYCILKDSDGNMKINMDSPVDWRTRPVELESKTDVFIVKADSHFAPQFSPSSVLYLEQSKNLAPESMIFVVESGRILLKKVWSVTPTTLQLCEIQDIELLKKNALPQNKLIELDRQSVEAIFKVIGYADFDL